MIEELLRCGVHHFCIAPGSRSTPLTWAVAENPKAKTHIHFDERGLAFMALGLAKASEEPVALICTSGSAVANFLPAVVEASQSHIPLILLTADRPPELIDTGANQAIIQPGIFSHYVRWEAQLSTPSEDVSPTYLLSTVDQAVYQARGLDAGPVHVNCPYREPLAPDGVSYEQPTEKQYSDWKNLDKPLTRYEFKGEYVISSDAIAGLIKASAKGVIITGQINLPDSERVMNIAKHLNWPVVADCTSNLRFGQDSQLILEHADLMLADSKSPLLEWDCVLQFGSPFVSKRLQQALENCPPEHFIRVAACSNRVDPGHQLTHRFMCSVASFENSVKKIPGAQDMNWNASCSESNARIVDSLKKARSLQELTEPGAIRRIIAQCPDDSVLILGSSMPIRDADMYGTAEKKKLEVTANRGASGIDGTVGTAVGFALSRKTVATLIIGDLTALHDLNSLAMVGELNTPFVVVVINNQGGGIFSMLPIAAQKKNFEPFWGTPHALEFEKFAAGFGLEYAIPQSLDELGEYYSNAIVSNKSTLIEIRTDRDENRLVHESLLKDFLS